jgi:hypothetical protein
LPRYLYLDNELINLRMVELGLAEPSFQSPDTELEAEFNRAAQDAEADGLGLWGANPTATPLSTATPEISDTTVETVTVTLPALTATTTITATGTPIITTTATITATTP